MWMYPSGYALNLALRLVLRVRQPTDAVSLEKPMQRGARQVWDGRLQRIQTIIER
jgi:hypothetical protein